jgi:intracellular septation protein A
MDKKASQNSFAYYDRWELLKRFPWKTLTLSLIIPRTIFSIAIFYDLLIPGAILTITWCLLRLIHTHLRARRIDWVALFALLTIAIRTLVSFLHSDPTLHMFLKTTSYALLGYFFLRSLSWPSSLIEIFVERAGTQFPEYIKTTPYYKEAWRKLSIIWGFFCLLGAAMLIFFKFRNPGIALKFDMIAGWPIIVLLFIFSAEFPRWYWKKQLDG